jgi:ureidoglycolate lyase
MTDSLVLTAEPLTAEAWGPFGQLIRGIPGSKDAEGLHEGESATGMTMELRDGEQFGLNVLTYERKPLVVDHLNRHHKASQALIALGGKPTLLVVAPKAFDFSTRDHLQHVRAFVCDGSAGVNIALGTWHWGPYPLMESVDLVNVQGAGFINDNEVAYLERDLGVVVNVRL